MDIQIVAQQEQQIQSPSSIEVADIFRIHGQAFRQNHVLMPEQADVMRDIVTCRTPLLGGHADVCQDCGHIEISYNSCRNRHCPKCQALAQARWIAQRQQRILPTHYFHLVFTIPQELRQVTLYNRKQLFKLLFASSSQTLLELFKDPQ